MNNNNPILIHPIKDGREAQVWDPAVGQEATDFINSVVPEPSREYIKNSSIEILRQCQPPYVPGEETGLIVGYVQSGKTMSFEAVTALAKDNGFQVVIVIAGTSNPLLDQSKGRFEKDFGFSDPSKVRRWVHYSNPQNEDATVQEIKDILEDWDDTDIPLEDKRTVLVTVLKQHIRLRKLTEVLAAIGMSEVPVLIIDDEADQASLNAGANLGEETTTYRRLLTLRSALPSHTYLQYTATPQAPLLISIIDALSPNFVQVLEPGPEYTGGREFFHKTSSLVRIIPAHEVPSNSNPLSEPPDSLVEALRIFMLGVTAGISMNNTRGFRSMLVHPSHLTARHAEYDFWVRNIIGEWRRTLSLEDGDLDKIDLIEDFRNAHADLSQTVGEDLPPFNDLTPFLKRSFRNTRVLEVNARDGKTPEVEWQKSYGWILVGGQAMDRGFTIEGLTVTYMPRGIGAGNADTIQQRARFFGYKRQYLGYCRVFLEEGTISAFQSYVDHEEDVRRQLVEIRDNRLSLNSWKRTFVLDRALRPCRSQVLEFDYIRGRISSGWVNPHALSAGEAIASENRSLVDTFCGRLDFIQNTGHPKRTDSQKHLVAEDVPLIQALEELLIAFRVTGAEDSPRNTGLLLQLGIALEQNEEEKCSVYVMSPNHQRFREIDDSGSVPNIYQGEAPVEPRSQRGSVYPGDRKIHNPSNVTIQIHSIDLKFRGSTVQRGVPVIAVWVPDRLGQSWISQHQPQQL